ncbi:sporulation initiation factor Spo0A C-terminal domain-containing protein [Pseudoneobacillus sp. C159]
MGNMKVMIVEENERFAEDICENINKQDGYEVVEVVHDGKSCLLSSQLKHTDILILNDLLPVIDGLTVLQELNKRGVMPSSVIFINSIPSQYVINQAKIAGARLILQTPFEMGHFINQMKLVTPSKGEQHYTQNELHTLITKCILSLGIVSHLDGFHYLLESVFMIVNDRNLEGSITKKVFPVISKNRHASVSTITKRINYAIHHSWTRSQKEMRDFHKRSNLMEYFSYEPSINEVIGLVINLILPKFTHQLDQSS